jgi:flagellar motor switch protein FliN/FliY
MSSDENNNTMDQDKLAEEWAAALAEQGQDGSTADNEAPPEGNSQDDLAEEWAKALAEEEESKMKAETQRASQAARPQDMEFEDFSRKDQPAQSGSKRDIEFILDIPLNLSAELGRSKLLINDLLQLGQGSVIELDKLAGEPLEILVNGKIVARGEAVVVNEKFGVRLTDIISPMERVKQLG